MPFTFAHPALVLPLTFLPRKWFSLTGLIIGSLTPDFEYFLKMKIESHYSHTFAGLFWFDIPIGILLAFLFHQVVRNPLFDHLPLSFRAKVIRFKDFNWVGYFKQNSFKVILSILIGAASHILWDSFTHSTGYFVSVIPFLSSSIHLGGLDYPILKIAQHLSTLIGSLALIFTYTLLPATPTPKYKINNFYWILFASLTAFIICLRLFTGLHYKTYGNLIVTIISAGMIALVLTSIYSKLKPNSNFKG